MIERRIFQRVKVLEAQTFSLFILQVQNSCYRQWKETYLIQIAKMAYPEDFSSHFVQSQA